MALNRCNLPRDRDVSLAYRTARQGDAIVIEWLGESKHSADDMVAASQSPDDHSQLEEACYVLYSILATHGGQMPATEVQEAAKDGLVSVGSLKRARGCSGCAVRRNRVKIAVPQSKNGETITVVRWMWQLPDDEELLRRTGSGCCGNKRRTSSPRCRGCTPDKKIWATTPMTTDRMLTPVSATRRPPRTGDNRPSCRRDCLLTGRGKGSS